MIVQGLLASICETIVPPPPPPPEYNFPPPGSGDYQSASVGLAGVTWASRGTPADPGGSVNSVVAPGSGLWYSNYLGTFTPSYGSLPSTWNMNFFNLNSPLSGGNDNFISFGNQADVAPTTNFSKEWLGYIKISQSFNDYNVYVTCDDDAVIWIGSNALTPTNSNYTAWGSNGDVPNIVNTNSLSLDNTKWYPIRIWFSEFTGNCKMQIFFIDSSGNKFNGNDISLAYSNTTHGFNP